MEETIGLVAEMTRAQAVRVAHSVNLFLAANGKSLPVVVAAQPSITRGPGTAGEDRRVTLADQAAEPPGNPASRLPDSVTTTAPRRQAVQPAGSAAVAMASKAVMNQGKVGPIISILTFKIQQTKSAAVPPTPRWQK